MSFPLCAWMHRTTQYLLAVCAFTPCLAWAQLAQPLQLSRAPLSYLYLLADTDHDSGASVQLMQAIASDQSRIAAVFAPKSNPPVAIAHLGDTMYPQLSHSTFVQSPLYAAMRQLQAQGIALWGTVGNHDMVHDSCATWSALWQQPCFGSVALNAHYTLWRFNSNAPLHRNSTMITQQSSSPDASVHQQLAALREQQRLGSLTGCHFFVWHHPPYLLDGRDPPPQSRYLMQHTSALGSSAFGHGHYLHSAPTHAFTAQTKPIPAPTDTPPGAKPTRAFTVGTAGAKLTAISPDTIGALGTEHFVLSGRYALVRLSLYPGAYLWEVLTLTDQGTLERLHFGTQNC